MTFFGVGATASLFVFFLAFSGFDIGVALERLDKVTQLLVIKWRGRGRISDSAATTLFRAAGAICGGQGAGVATPKFQPKYVKYYVVG